MRSMISTVFNVRNSDGFRYDRLGEYCGSHTASSVFLILTYVEIESAVIAWESRQVET